MFDSMISAYLLLFITGIGFSLLLTSWHKKPLALAITLAPLISACLLAVIGVYYLSTYRGQYSASDFLIFTAMASITIAFFLIIKKGIMNLSLRLNGLVLTYMGITVFLSLLLCNYHDGIITHYLNPDISAYLASSQWITDGHKINPLNGVYIVEIFGSALRWGLPFLTGTIAQVLHANTAELLYPVILIIFFHGLWAISLLFNTSFFNSSNDKRIFFTAITMLLNGSLLYFILEGFCPSILAVIFLNLIVLLLATPITKRNAIQILLIVTLFSGAIITLYSELYILTWLIILGSLFFSGILRNKEAIKSGGLILLSMLLGFLSVLPLSHKVIDFTSTNALNINNIGYPQPRWITPSDLVSLTNPYLNPHKFISCLGSYYTKPTSLVLNISVLLLSLWMLYVIARWRKGKNLLLILSMGAALLLLHHFSNIVIFVLSLWVAYEIIQRWGENPIVLTLIAGIASFFLYDRFMIQYHQYPPYNYFYDKLATDVSPLLIAFFIGSIYNNPSLKTLKIKIGIVIACATLSVSIMLSSWTQIRGYTDLNSLNQIKNTIHAPYVFLVNARGYRQGEFKGYLRFVDRCDESIMSAYLGDNFIDQWDPNSLKQFSNNQPVLLIIRKTAIQNEKQYREKYSQQIILDTPFYFVLNTHKTVGDLASGDFAKNMQAMNLW